MKDYTWTRVEGDHDVEPNQESPVGAPPPRANAGSYVYNNKVYIYGGHGGLNYARVAFSDIWSFDLETLEWHKYEPVQQAQPPPEGRGGNSVFVVDDKLYSYGGWNMESQFTNLIVFDLNTCEWADPDIMNGVARWNHAAVMVEAIPSWKYFIFGGESTDFGEAQPRAFGQVVNSACYLDLETMRWSPIELEDAVLPPPREYTTLSYDHRDSRLLVFGGWNNGWLDDMYALAVSKIVGPSYAITDIDPPLGQLSGGIPITITGCGFKDSNIKVYFTAGEQRAEVPGRNSVDVAGTFVSETELTAVTPGFEQFGPKGAVVQLSIQGGDLTTTFVPFSFFMNTRALMSLCYGPGVQDTNAAGAQVEFIIQARNDSAENRSSGRDEFKVTIQTVGGEEEQPMDIECDIEDRGDGSYQVTYQVDEPCEVSVAVLFRDDKGKMVPVRGSPYRASFEEGVNPNVNGLIGPGMPKHVAKQIESLQEFMKSTAAGAQVKDKDLADVKALIGVKDNVEAVQNRGDEVTLQLDQLDEALQVLLGHNMVKEKEVKQAKRLADEWNGLKKLAKDTKKEIAGLVDTEAKKNSGAVGKLDEDLKVYINEMRKRDFYKYETGRETSLESLRKVHQEIEEFQEKIAGFRYTSMKFGTPEIIEVSERQIETVINEAAAMQGLWDHVEKSQLRFQDYLNNSWLQTNSDEMEEEVKRLLATLKGMSKVDKRCNAYIGLLDECKRWLVLLPMVTSLRHPAMRERHWDTIREKSNASFVVDDKLVLREIYDLNLGKIADDVEEVTD